MTSSNVTNPKKEHETGALAPAPDGARAPTPEQKRMASPTAWQYRSGRHSVNDQNMEYDTQSPCHLAGLNLPHHPLLQARISSGSPSSLTLILMAKRELWIKDLLKQVQNKFFGLLIGFLHEKPNFAMSRSISSAERAAEYRFRTAAENLSSKLESPKSLIANPKCRAGWVARAVYSQTIIKTGVPRTMNKNNRRNHFMTVYTNQRISEFNLQLKV